MFDLLLSNDPNMVEEVEVGEHLGVSDHNIECAKIMLRVRVQDSRVRLFDFRKANLEGMRRELGDVDWEKLTIGQSNKRNGKPSRSKFVECRVSTFQ